MKVSKVSLQFTKLGDSQTALRALGGHTRNTTLRSVYGKVQDHGMSLLERFPKLKIKFVWLLAQYNCSDLNSKVQTDAISVINSEFWQFGPKKFTDQSFLESKTIGILSPDSHLFALTAFNMEHNVFSTISEQAMNVDEQQIADTSHNGEHTSSKDDVHSVQVQGHTNLTQSQSYLFRQNIGAAKIVNAQYANLFPTQDIKYSPIKPLPELYVKLLD